MALHSSEPKARYHKSLPGRAGHSGSADLPWGELDGFDCSLSAHFLASLDNRRAVDTLASAAGSDCLYAVEGESIRAAFIKEL